MPDSFLDSNVVLYVASSDAAKAARARMLMAERPFISVQTLNEIVNVTRRKMRWDWQQVIEFLDTIGGLTRVVPVDLSVHEQGLALAQRYSLSTYDAMIAGAALVAGCTTLWSEDMQHGLLLANRLRVLNPFISA